MGEPIFALSKFEFVKLSIIGISGRSIFGYPTFVMRDSCSAILQLHSDDEDILCALMIDLHAQIIPFKEIAHREDMAYYEYMYTRFDQRCKIFVTCTRPVDADLDDMSHAKEKLKEQCITEFIKLRFLFEQYSRGIGFQWDDANGKIVFRPCGSDVSDNNSQIRTNVVARGAENTGVLLRKG